jgi:flagellar biosynthesis/type III secretory pathway chaperone
MMNEFQHLSHSEITESLNKLEPQKKNVLLSTLREQSYRVALFFLECSEFYQKTTVILSELLKQIEKTTQFLKNYISISKSIVIPTNSKLTEHSDNPIHSHPSSNNISPLPKTK